MRRASPFSISIKVADERKKRSQWLPGAGLRDLPDAAKCALEERLLNMEIMLGCDMDGREIALPVLPEWCLFDERALRPVAGHPWPSLTFAA